MWNRFKDSLLNPKHLVEYRNDSLLRVLLYMFIFVVLLATRTIITGATFDGISYGDRENLIQQTETMDPDCVMIDAVYSCDTEKSQLFLSNLMVSYYFDSSETLDYSSYDNQYNVVINKDKIHIVTAGIPLYTMLIEDLPDDLHYINFEWQTTDPSYFYDSIFGGISEYIVVNKPIWVPTMIIMDMLSSILLFMIFVLISAWMLKARFKVIKFKHLFIMTVYSSTALYVLLIFNSLYNISLFIMILLVIVAVRQNSQLSVELYKRLNKKS